jgi:DNA-binding GntR family transcriptional regulator
MTRTDLDEPADQSVWTSPVERVPAPILVQVCDQLRRAILELRFTPGQRLIERELTEAFGVSRPTIREALQQLTAERLLRPAAGGGRVVNAPSAAEAREIYEVRAVLEAMAARSFVARATDQEVAELRARLEDIRRIPPEKCTSIRMLAAKTHFYDVLLECARNDTIRTILYGLQAQVTYLRATSLSQPGRRDQTLVEIEAIVSAIEARDADAAAAASEHHVRTAANTAFAALSTDSD